MAVRLVAVRAHAPAQMAAAVTRIWDAGDAVAPIDPDLPAAATKDLIDRLRPQQIVSSTPTGSSVENVDGAPLPDGTAAVVTTSGSGGAPRPVVLSHAAMDASARASILRLGCRQGQRWLLTLPLHHVAGLQVLRRAALLGAGPRLLPRFDPAAVGHSDAAWLALVPTMLVRLLDHGVDLSGRTILVGGAAVAADLVARARAAGATVVASYGMTETCGGCVYDGVPLDGVTVTVRDDGLIAVAGAMVADGIRSPDGSVVPVRDRDGWLVTADLGRWREGRLQVLGRADAVIVTGGVNVPAQAVEACLRGHPGVADAAVLGLPDPEWGHRVVALVVPSDPSSPPTRAALRDHVGAHLGRVARPHRVRLTGRLPVTTLGKVARAELAEAWIQAGGGGAPNRH